jgi:HEAT repeat protein
MLRVRWLLATYLVTLPLQAATGEREGPLWSERLVWPGAIGAVEKQLGSEDIESRRRAAVDLGRLPPSVQRRLLPRLFSDPDADVRLAAADAALAIRLPDAGARVSKWLSDPDARVREAAAEVLAVLRDPASIAGLGRALEDSDASVRAAAARALGNSRGAEATSFLLGHLDDADPEVRQAVISALEDLGDPRAVVPLIGRLQEQRAALRRQAARALASLGDARAVGALTVALSDADAGVRAAAATALGRLGARDAVWSLGTLLDNEPDPEVAAAVLDALGAIQTPGAVDAILRGLALPRPTRDPIERALRRSGEVALPSLERCVFQPSRAENADVCVAALGGIGGESASRAIERALRQGAVSAATALSALGDAGHPSALPTVLEFLTSAVPAERRAAIDAAGRLLDPDRDLGVLVEPIVQAMNHARESRLEHAALIGLLGRTGSARAAASLVPIATSHDEYLRVVALQALGQIGPAGADAALLDGLASSSFPTRYTAALALRRVGTKGSIDSLLDRLEVAPFEQRENIALALAGPLREGASAPQLERVIALVRSSDAPIADALIEAVGHIPGEGGSQALSALTPSLGKAGRAKVAEVLAAHPDAVDALRGLSRDADASVRANAVWSLGAVGSAGDIGQLVAAREDADIAVAANSVAAIARIAARHELDQSVPLCAALEDPRAYVLANALSGLRVAGLSCPSPAPATWLLEQHPSDEVRLAAARLIRERWVTIAPAELARCAAKDVSGRVAAECAKTRDDGKKAVPANADEPEKARSPSGAADRVSDMGVLVVQTGEVSPAPQVAFALVRADGLIRCGTSDRRGALWEPTAPRGELRLTLPAVFAE